LALGDRGWALGVHGHDPSGRLLAGGAADVALGSSLCTFRRWAGKRKEEAGREPARGAPGPPTGLVTHVGEYKWAKTIAWWRAG
jgi:hypothetical protein